MTYPNFPDKHPEKAFFSPTEYLEYAKTIGRFPQFPVPKGVIFSYQRKLMAYVLENHPVTKVDFNYGEMYLLDETEGQIALVGNFGIGAPVVGTILEELIAFGVQHFISIGTAGTLQKDLTIWDLMVCEKAIRDEGTSHHYLPAGKYAHADPAMTAKIQHSLDRLNQPYSLGTSWTIDAPYRETVAEIQQYQAEGVATVEMEAAALFAIAEYRKVQMGAMFSISDSLAEFKWDPKFHWKATDQGLEILYQVAIEVLMQE